MGVGEIELEIIDLTRLRGAQIHVEPTVAEHPSGAAVVRLVEPRADHRGDALCVLGCRRLSFLVRQPANLVAYERKCAFDDATDHDSMRRSRPLTRPISRAIRPR